MFGFDTPCSCCDSPLCVVWKTTGWGGNSKFQSAVFNDEDSASLYVSGTFVRATSLTSPDPNSVENRGYIHSCIDPNYRKFEFVASTGYLSVKMYGPYSSYAEYGISGVSSEPFISGLFYDQNTLILSNSGNSPTPSSGNNPTLDIYDIQQSTGDPDWYGWSAFNLSGIGDVELRIERCACKCDCHSRIGEFTDACQSGDFAACYSGMPETYTMQINSISPFRKLRIGASSSGTSWAQNPSISGVTYLPPGDWWNKYISVPQGFLNYPLQGCDDWLSRFQDPIVLQRVPDPSDPSDVTYASDPIAFAPCSAAIFTFSINKCSSTLDVSSLYDYSFGTFTQFKADGGYFTRNPPCVWEMSYWQDHPSGYTDHFLAETFYFDHDNISITAGGTYTPEPFVVCAKTSPGYEDMLSFTSNCRGAYCPPDEYIVRLIYNSGALPAYLAGDYYLPAPTRPCTLNQGFAADRHITSLVVPGSGNLYIQLAWAHSPGTLSYSVDSNDKCPCGELAPSLRLSFTNQVGYNASTNVYVFPQSASGNAWTSPPCVPFCNDGDLVVDFGTISGQVFGSPSSMADFCDARVIVTGVI